MYESYIFDNKQYKKAIQYEIQKIIYLISMIPNLDEPKPNKLFLGSSKLDKKTTFVLNRINMNWQDFKKYTKPLIRNKYFLASLAFIVWIAIFDQNNLVDRFQLQLRINKLEKQKDHYIHEIEQNNRKMQELQSSTGNLEKFGREEYLMKKKDEVLFIVEEEK